MVHDYFRGIQFFIDNIIWVQPHTIFLISRIFKMVFNSKFFVLQKKVFSWSDNKFCTQKACKIYCHFSSKIEVLVENLSRLTWRLHWISIAIAGKFTDFEKERLSRKTAPEVRLYFNEKIYKGFSAGSVSFSSTQSTGQKNWHLWSCTIYKMSCLSFQNSLKL